jgi:MinD-like ATPase involved in chromosome partitioning or flagellar assembly
MGHLILIIDHRADVLCRIGYALYRGGYQTVFARNAEEGLLRARADHPHLVVIGPQVTDMAPEQVRGCLAQDPATSALPVLLLEDGEAANGRALPGLVGRIDALLADERPDKQSGRPGAARVIGFLGARGGVGTTTLALHVARALVEAGQRVIAAEVNVSIGAFAGQLGEIPLTNLSHLLALAPDHIDRAAVASLLVKHASGLQVLYGPRWTDEYREISPGQARALVEALIQMADAVVLDLPRHFSPGVRATLVRCDSVVLVLEPEPACVAIARATIELLHSCGVAADALTAIVVHRSPREAGAYLGEIRRQLGLAIAGVVPYTPRAAGAGDPPTALGGISARLADG